MPKLFLTFFHIFLLTSLSTKASSTHTITLGDFVTYTSETDDYELTSAEVVAFSSTSGWTLKRKKCHAKKVRTGQGFPYRYNYTAHSISAKANVSFKGKSIQVNQIEEAVEKAKEELSDLVPFYCGRDHHLGLKIEVKVEGSEKASAYLSLGLDSQGLYVEKSYGRIYVENAEVDFVPSL